MKKKNTITNDESLVMGIDELVGMVHESLGKEGNMSLPPYYLYQKYSSLADRQIWIDKDVDSTLMEDYRQILQWNIEDERNKIPVEERKVITVNILSYGGQLDTALAFCNLLLMSKTPCKTVAISDAMSAACLIFLCGHEGMRYIMPMTSLLLHEGSSGGSEGTYSQQEAAQANYKKLQSFMKQLILDHTKIDQKLFNKNRTKDWFIYPDDAISLGIADHIVGSIEDLFPSM